MVTFKDYIPGLLPNSMLDRDSYKDVDNKGFVERFLGAFGVELDSYQSARLEIISYLYDPMGVTGLPGISSFDPTFDISFGGADENIGAYLDNFAIALGDVPRFLSDDHDYARFLTYLISIWKIKGTAKSFKALLTIPGHDDLVITETPPDDILYDSDPPILYDTDDILYDLNCATCTDYQIILTTTKLLTGEEYRKVWELIYLIEPIGARLSEINWSGTPVIHSLIEVTVDDSGDLVYNNPDDGTLSLAYVSGDLIVTSAVADRYFISDGLLYFIIY